ncbi:MAG: gliding motility-associated C-terminal domain-containing protein [Saprospiraceae bacterium]|nr:gliding motility-associated C-terminal domain-containing protein [Saprospiraceae bacterium]
MLLLQCATIAINAQHSFLKEIQAPIQYPFTLPGVAGSGDDKLSLLIQSSSGIQLPDISAQGTVLGGVLIRHENPAFLLSGFGSLYRRSGKYHLVSGRTHPPPTLGSFSSTFVYNAETGGVWAKQTAFLGLPPRPVFISERLNRAVLGQYYSQPTPSVPNNSQLGFSAHDLDNGAAVWQRFYRRQGVNSIRTYIGVDVREFPDGDFSVIVRGQTATPGPENISHYLLKLDTLGLPLKSSGIIGDSVEFVNHDINSSGHIFLCGYVSPSPVSNDRQGFIARLDSGYNVLWAKKMLTDQFRPVGIRVQTVADGGVVFVYYTTGDLPVISGKISSEGELLWYRGFPFFQPVVSTDPEGALYFFSSKKYYEDGSWEYAPILAKTTPAGTIEDCPELPACLYLADMELSLQAFEWVSEPSPVLPDVTLEVLPATLGLNPHCGTPAPPSPNFVLPDTVCQGSCIYPDSLSNRLANYVQWRISGPALDTIIADSTFLWCFDVPGRYTVEQEIWLLGCSDFYSRSIEILPENLTPPLGDDIRACSPPLTLLSESSRPLRSWRWHDGSNRPDFVITQSGSISLSASDGYCEVHDSVMVTFVSLSLLTPVIENIQDTTVCIDLLPFVFQPRSEYAGVFSVSEHPLHDSIFQINKPGIYTVFIDIENCTFSDSFHLNAAPCPVKLYLPNAFSPNGDGINDLWEPLGIDFMGIHLEIFNRWGGLLHRTDSGPFAWNGVCNGRPLNTGTYLAVFTYKNLLTGLEEKVSEEVLLVR